MLTLTALQAIWLAILVTRGLPWVFGLWTILQVFSSSPVGSVESVLWGLVYVGWSSLEPLTWILITRVMLEIACVLLVPAAIPKTAANPALRAISSIFVLRPVFTARGLRILWIVFCAAWLAWMISVMPSSVKAIIQLLAPQAELPFGASHGVVVYSNVTHLVTALLAPFVNLALARIVIEVAMKVLPGAREAGAKKRRPMNVLLIGSGGREHALAWKLSQSPRLGRLYAAPGNPGIAECAEIAVLDVGDHQAVADFCRGRAIDLVVVGPEAPLVAGLVDDLAAFGIRAFGPSGAAAQLEGSKGFTKDLCAEAAIPTAAYGRFTDAEAAKAYARQQGAPIVVKADGLAAGKGVTVAATLDQALAAIDDCFAGAFGEAGAEVVVEACLVGEEASVFALTDGKAVVMLATAQDHKPVGEGDTGPNTGGMGAYSPAPVMTPDLVERTLAEIIRPTVAAMRDRGTPFAGVLYAGLMITAEGPKLIEYNVRFGDPETQALMMRLDSDLLDLLEATAAGTLAEVTPTWSDDAALTVVMAARGYPGAYDKGSPIGGIDAAEALPGVKVFHAGTALRDGQLVANGGRVLNVTATGPTIAEAQARAYQAVDAIDWPEGFCRRDIGWRAVSDTRQR